MDEGNRFARGHAGIHVVPAALAWCEATGAQARTFLTAVLSGYELAGDDAIHAARAVRSALHGFVLLETGGGFGIKLDLDESFARLVGLLDHGLRS